MEIIALILGLSCVNAGADTPNLILEPPVYEFQCGGMRGFIRPVGTYHGLVISGYQNQPITKSGLCTLNLEHYVCADAHGQFLPRKKHLQQYRTEGQSVTIVFSATDEWKVETSLKYDFSSAEYISALFTFRFGADYRGFEAFVASYMQQPTPPLVRTGGLWIRLQPEQGWQMFLAKTKTHAEMVMDGRWSWFPETLRPKVVDGTYDLPVLVTRDDETGYALIQMADPRECMGLSPNTFAPAHDLSLVGHDVKSGDEVSVPIRLYYRKIDSMTEVEDLYNQFRKDLGIPEE